MASAKKRLVCVLCTVLLLLCLCPGRVLAQAQAQMFHTDIEAYQLEMNASDSVQMWLDDVLTAQVGASAEWYVLALAQSGREFDLSAYTAALLTYLEGDTTSGAATKLKYALVLAAAGCENDYIAETLASCTGARGIVSWIYGLHLLNNGYSCEAFTAADVVEALLALQLADGGWALYGESADVDITAMVLQALAPHASQHPEAVGRAVALLSSRQTAEGDYMSMGLPNPEGGAQVVLALTALGIDPRTDVRFLKDDVTLLDGMQRYQLPDGSFQHTLDGGFNAMATAQVYLAMTALERFDRGAGSLFLLDRSGSAEEGGESPTGEHSEESISATKPIPSGISEEATPVQLWLTLGIAGAGAVTVVVLFIRKRRHPVNFLVTILLTGAGIALVWMLDIRTPEDYYGGANVPTGESIGSVTLEIRCDTVAGKGEYLPTDGVILTEEPLPIMQGDTVFDVLTRAVQAHGIQLEYDGTPQLAYVKGLANLYEFDYGDLSGWVFHVNGTAVSEGCGEYVLQDGDAVEWLYSCALGDDLTE